MDQRRKSTPEKEAPPEQQETRAVTAIIGNRSPS